MIKEINIELDIPYAIYHVGFKYREPIQLSAIQSLILILIKSFNKNKSMEKLISLITLELNINYKFYIFFEKEFNKLIDSEALKNNSSFNFYEVLIGSLVINEKINTFLDEGKFLGNSDNTITYDYIFANNLFSKSILKEESKKFNDGEIINYFIKTNKKINEKYMNLIDCEANKIHSKLIYIDKEFKKYEKNKYINFENIGFLSETINFEILENQLMPKNEISEEVLKLYNEGKYYLDINEKITNKISSKFKFKLLNNSINEIDELEINKEKIINFDNRNFIFYNNKIIELFLKCKELVIKNINKKIEYFVTCYLELKIDDWVNDLIINWSKNNDNTINSVLFLLNNNFQLENEIKEKIGNSIVNNLDLTKIKIKYIKSNFNFFKNYLYKIEFKNLYNILISENNEVEMIKKIIDFDFEHQKKYFNCIKNTIITDEEIQIHIICKYKLDYISNKTYFVKYKGIEEKINYFIDKYRKIKSKYSLDDLFSFEKELNSWLLLKYNKLNYIFENIIYDIKKMILEKENSNINLISDKLTILAKKIRDFLEPICKEYNNKEKTIVVIKKISEKIKWDKLYDEWKFIQRFMHNEQKKEEIYNNKTVSRIEKFLNELEQRNWKKIF